MTRSRRSFLVAGTLGGLGTLGALFSRRAMAAMKEFDPFRKSFSHSDPKHTPVLTAPDTVKAGQAFDVAIEVGRITHPMQTGHSLRWIELYAGNVQLARVELIPIMTRPKVTLTIVLDQTTTLRALAMPNHSGAFAGTKEVRVTS